MLLCVAVCMQVEAFLGALIDLGKQSEEGGTAGILRMICQDLVMIAVQTLADGNLRKSCGAYGALDFVADAHGMSICEMLSYSTCLHDVTVHIIRLMSAGMPTASVRACSAYVLIRRH